MATTADERTRTWRVGAVTITSVVEAETHGIPPQLFFPDATADDVLAHEWVVPTWADERGRIGMRVQALVLQTPTRTIVVDPCVGNGKTLSMPFWNDQAFPFLERFRAAGFDPELVDLVVHTHLHEDHIGWDTQCVDGVWTPTFPHARHLYVGEGLDALRISDRPDAAASSVESIDPIFAAGLADVIAAPGDGGHDLGEGLQLVSTPGHLPGHVSMWITAPGADDVLVTGDVVHHPVQLARPDLAEIGDADPELARATRRRMFAEAARRQALVIGTHFPTEPAGRIVDDGAAWRFVTDPLHG
jgi:glyoxylase-like metal-dependent hydrolase (beta-lactamase superfamily II)